jgi:aminopeptidase N
MTSSDTQTIYLAHYQPPAFLVEHVALEFTLHPTATRVRSTIKFRKNPDSLVTNFFLHGEGLTLLSSYVNGVAISPEPNV